VHDPPISSGIPRPRVVFDEIKTDADHEVRFVQARELVIPREHPDRQEVHRGRPRHRPFPHECVSDRDVKIFSEPTQLIRCTAPDHAVPREHDRPLGPLNQIGCLVEARSIRRRVRDALDGQRSRGRIRLFICDVFGQFDVRRARLLRLGQLERLPYDFRNRVRAFNPGIPLCDGVKQLQDVHELMGFSVHPRQVRLGRDCHERSAVEEGIGYARDEIRRSGPQRREANPRVGGEPSVDVRHERSGPFVAGEDEADRAFPKGVHQLQVLLAGNPKSETDPFVFEAGDEESRGLHASGMADTPIYRMWKPRNGGPHRKGRGSRGSG